MRKGRIFVAVLSATGAGILGCTAIFDAGSYDTQAAPVGVGPGGGGALADVQLAFEASDGRVIPVGQGGCDFAGTWGVKITTTITWPDTAAVSGGSGQLIEYFRLDRTQVNKNSLSDVTTLCSFTYPDFNGKPGTATAGYHWGFTLPDAIYKGQTGISTASSATVTKPFPGASYFTQAPFTTVLGVALTDPTRDPWPGQAMTQSINAIDVDMDGLPGMTATAKVGATPDGTGINGQYSLLTTSISLGIKNVDRVAAAFRESFALSGTIQDCSTISGRGNFFKDSTGTLDVNSRVLGCIYAGHAAGEAPGQGTCDSTETKFLDDNVPLPVMDPPDTKFFQVKLGDTTANPSCADVIKSVDSAIGAAK